MWCGRPPHVISDDVRGEGGRSRSGGQGVGDTEAQEEGPVPQALRGGRVPHPSASVGGLGLEPERRNGRRHTASLPSWAGAGTEEREEGRKETSGMWQTFVQSSTGGGGKPHQMSI